MKIIFAAYNACIRTLKEGLALCGEGHNVIFIQRELANRGMIYVLPLVSFYDGSKEHYVAKLKGYSGIDIIHVHNEPSWLGYLAKEAHPGVPVVFDAHDLNAVRDDSVDADEVRSMNVCDAVIFPSNGYRDYCLNEFKDIFTTLKDKPTEVIYSMCDDFMMNLPALPRVGGIVYQGGTYVFVNYRDYRSLADELRKRNIVFYIYHANKDETKDYADTGAVCMPTLPYLDLLRNLSRFDWGLVGSPVKSRQWDTAMPNKMFDYIAAGIPCLVYQAEEAAEFVTRHGLGVVVESLDEIPQIYNQHEYYRKIVQQKRHELTMEGQVNKILDIYNGLLDNRQAGQR